MFNLTGRIATYGLSAFALVLSGALTLKTLEARRLESERDILHARLYDESSGYIVRLASCRRDSFVLEQAISDRNERISALEAETIDRLNRSSNELAAIQSENTELRSRLDDLLSQPVIGETSCARVEDVDRRIMEWLAE